MSPPKRRFERMHKMVLRGMKSNQRLTQRKNGSVFKEIQEDPLSVRWSGSRQPKSCFYERSMDLSAHPPGQIGWELNALMALSVIHLKPSNRSPQGSRLEDWN